MRQRVPVLSSRLPTQLYAARCIVNGPGEMADADFGYVGGAPGKIDLYVGKEVRPCSACMSSSAAAPETCLMRIAG